MGVLQIAVVCFTATCLIQMVSTQPTAEIDGTTIIGETVSFIFFEVHQYLGIPYAQPPVGPLRFQKPQPFQNYSTEFEAFDNPPACPQYTTQPYPWYFNTTHQSEDCLYLNIWTPADASPRNKKAVMYWMYGGGHRYGTISDPLYNGTRMVLLGDIIVVTVNYRVGYFGFLTSNSEDAPGNVGIWDVLEGLKWVNKNIEAFGGDASRITIAGETAGAINVGLLAITPLAKGLYARQIMQTASPLNRRSDNNTQNLAFSQELAVYVGCANESFTIMKNPKEVVECLKGVDADKISKADYELAPMTGYHLVPQFDDELFLENPRESIIKGDFTCTDLLIGNIKDVGSYTMTTLEYQDYFGFFGEKDPRVNRSMGEEMIRKRVANFPDPDAIVNYYLPKDLIRDFDHFIRTEAYTAMGDTGFLCPTVYYAEQCSEKRGNVYFYFFSHRPSHSHWAPWMGATHFDDMQFVFGYAMNNPEYKYLEYFLSEDVIEIWSTFVKYGKPGDESWPLYSKGNHSYRLIGDDYTQDVVENGPHLANCEFLKPHFGY